MSPRWSLYDKIDVPMYNGGFDYCDNFDLDRANLKNNFQVAILTSLGPLDVGAMILVQEVDIFNICLFIPGVYFRNSS